MLGCRKIFLKETIPRFTGYWNYVWALFKNMVAIVAKMEQNVQGEDTEATKHRS